MNIGKYNVLAYLGAGGMAEVFKCQLKGIGGFDKVVVVKRIRPDVAGDAQFMQMFLDEARLAAMLTHPNIVQVYEVDQVQGLPYIAMEYADGPSLVQVIREARRRNLIHYGHMARVISGIALGLDYAHQVKDAQGNPLGIVHRDVTPHNVVVTMTGAPKLLDFGIAKAEGRLSQTKAGGFKGKYAYVAPEVLKRGEVTHLCDVYSLGVTLYQATVGHLPFTAESDAHLLKLVSEGEFEPPSKRVSDYPEALERIVLWAMRSDPELRCPGARMLYNTLEKLISAGECQSTPDDFVAWLTELFPTSEAYLEAKAPPYVSSLSSGQMTSSQYYSASFDASREGVMPRSNTLRIAIGAAAALVIGLLGALLWVLTRPPPQPVAVAQQAPAPPDESPTLASFLDEAEKLAREGKYGPASELLGKAGKLQHTEAQLQIRLTRLNDQVETGSMVASARRALQLGDRSTAVEVAKRLLDRDDQNAAALAILEDARPKAPEPSKNKPALRRPPMMGKLTVTAAPQAVVYVDDRPYGRTPVTVSLEPGAHEIEARIDGYEAMKRAVKVRAGRLETAAFKLAKAEHKPAPIAAPVEPAAAPTIAAAPPAPPPEPAAAPAVIEEPPTQAATAAADTSQPGGLLPRQRVVETPQELARLFKAVENECLAGGAPADKINNVTLDLARELVPRLGGGRSVTVFPRGMYSLIMKSVSSGLTASGIGAAVKQAHNDGGLER
jgi:serine/threonine-protein kinase